MIEFELVDTGGALGLSVRAVVIAGWAGRDQASIDEHVEELKAIGVRPPSATPLFYRVSADLLTTAANVEVLGAGTSGEVEVLLLGTAAGTLVGVASDHTDRDAESWSVAHSKQLCAKPAGRALWHLRDLLEHWDALVLESHAIIAGERVLYQRGPVSGLLAPADLLTRFGRSACELAPGEAMLCGTLPVIGGVRPADSFEIALIDPVRGRRIDHAYQVHVLPVVA